MRKLLTFAMLGIFSSSAFANDNIFSCNTEDGKMVSVQKIGANYVFSYGNVTFTNPITQVTNNENSYIATGSGFITSSLELQNGHTTYTIEFVQPRNNPKEVDDPTLYITKGNDMKTIRCNNVHHNLDKKIMRTQ